MSATNPDPAADAVRLRQRGLRVTGPRLAILAMLEQVGGHRSADELVLALRRSGYHHARTTVYNALDDLARAGLVRAAPVDSGALHYETAGAPHHHFVCRSCGVILNVPIAADLTSRPLPDVEGGNPDELDIVYRGVCDGCSTEADGRRSGSTTRPQAAEVNGDSDPHDKRGGDGDKRMSSVTGGADVAMSRGATPGEPSVNERAAEPGADGEGRPLDLRPA
jgi:Fe2+ or Zn2+ uptake regulation protein